MCKNRKNKNHKCGRYAKRTKEISGQVKKNKLINGMHKIERENAHNRKRKRYFIIGTNMAKNTSMTKEGNLQYTKIWNDMKY